MRAAVVAAYVNRKTLFSRRPGSIFALLPRGSGAPDASRAGLSSAGAFFQGCELCLKNAAFQRRSEEVIDNKGVQEVDGENAAPDPGYPLDEPTVRGQDVDGQDEEHHRNEDGQVLQESHSLVRAVSGLAPELFLLGKRGVIAVVVPEASSHFGPPFVQRAAALVLVGTRACCSGLPCADGRYLSAPAM